MSRQTAKKERGRRGEAAPTPPLAVEVTTIWSETRLDVRQLAAGDPRRSRLVIGEVTSCDLWVSGDQIGGQERLTIIETDESEARIQVPLGATAVVALADDDEAVVDRPAERSIGENGETSGVLRLPLTSGWSALLEVGELSFRVRTIEPERLSLPLRWREWPIAALVFASLVVHGLLLMLALTTPPPPRTLSLDMLEQDNRFVRYLVQESEPVTMGEIQAWVHADGPADDQGGRGRRHRGEEGQLGRIQRSDNRFGIRGPASTSDVHMARERAKQHAASAGVLAALRSRSPSSPFRGRASLDNDPTTALGSLMGNQVGTSFGAGGLGLRGTGRGGARASLGLGGLSKIGHGRVAARSASRQMSTTGVLASNFVGGQGVEARLSDLLDRGVMVDGDSIRLEAFQDRQPLPYAVPTDEAVALYAELERGRIVARGDTAHLQIALVGRQGEAPRRPRMDIRLLMDCSGSMAGEKWGHALAAAHALVRRLEPTDTFGLISYSDEAALTVAPRPVGNGEAIHRALDRLRPGGGTNISEALRLAGVYRPRRRQPTDLGLVMLISDGQATAGITSPVELGAMSRRLFDEDGVLTTTVGLGAAFDEQTMLTIAREGNGSYHFVRRPSEISTILQDELEDRARAIAQGLRVRVVLAPGVGLRRVYGSRMLSEQEHAAVRATEVAVDRRLARELGVTRDRQQEQEEGLRMHIGSFRRGDQHVILMELDLPPGAVGAEAAVAQVFLDYKDLSSRSNEQTVEAVTAERVETRDQSLASLRRTVKRTVLSFQAGEALQVAAEALGTGQPAAARRLLSERRELLEAAAELWRDPAMRRDAALIGRYETVLARVYPGWSSYDQSTLRLAMASFGDRRMR